MMIEVKGHPVEPQKYGTATLDASKQKFQDKLRGWQNTETVSLKGNDRGV